jgi:nitrogen fixation-related uncharacterized protein
MHITITVAISFPGVALYIGWLTIRSKSHDDDQ